MLVMLVYGAGVVSLGIGLAVWVQRPGRALLSAVVLYVLLSVPMPLGVMALGMGSVVETALESPFFAVGCLTDQLRNPLDTRLFCWIVVWLVGYCVATLVLMAITIRTFDRSLGRMGDHGEPRPRTPR
jgi:hypothetical protein